MNALSSSREPARYVITGPTGWLGRGFLKSLSDEIGEDWSRRVTLFGSSDRELKFLGECLTIRELGSITPEDTDDAILIHLAFLGGEQVAIRGASEFAATNRLIDQQVLKALDRGRPRAAFVSSSGTAAQAERGAASPYGTAKLIQEGQFLEFALRTKIPVMVGRIFNLGGPYINKIDAYALSSFLVQGFAGGPIRIGAQTPVYRSYVNVCDVSHLVVRELETQSSFPSSAIDLCGPLVTEMQDVAWAAASVTGLPRTKVERDVVDFSRSSIYLGDASKIRSIALRHRLELTSFHQQVEATGKYLLEEGLAG